MKVSKDKIVLVLDVGDKEFTTEDCSLFVGQLSEDLYPEWEIAVDDVFYNGRSFNGDGEITDNQIGDIYIDY